MSESPHGLKRSLLECGFALVVGIVLTLLVEWTFGEEFVTRQQARAYAPIAGGLYGSGRRDAIRVLLIDDAALAAAGQTWPAHYSYSARLLRAVGQYRPKAVFVDIYYSAQRDDASLPALLGQVCALHEQGVKVFLAVARNRQDAFLLRPELDALDGKCFEKVAVQYTPDEIDRLAWNYTLAMPGAGAAHGAPGIKSAALALYETGGAMVEAEHHPLALTWGSEPAAHGVGWVTSVYGADAGASYCRGTHGLAELLPPGPRSALFEDADKPLCVFHETIRAGELASTTTQEDARLRRLIEGKILLIGTALSDSNDLVLSPLHGRIPGVYLHAMALDNLMTFGQGYARAMHLSPDPANGKLLVFLLFAMIVVTLVPKQIMHRFAHRFERPAKARCDPAGALLYLLWCLGRVAVSLLVGCLMLWIGQYWLGLGFLSIINVIVLTLLAEWFEFNEKLSKYLLPATASTAKGNPHDHE